MRDRGKFSIRDYERLPAGVTFEVIDGVPQIPASLFLEHEDIAGVELRLTQCMRDMETRLSLRMSELEAGFRKEMAAIQVSLIRWMVSLMVVQSGFMIVLAWVSKRWF